MEQHILDRLMALIQSAWDEEVYTSAFESVLGLHSEIGGEQEFMAKVREILEKQEPSFFVHDIRNKLSPVTNLIALLEAGEIGPSNNELILNEINKCKESIKYLTNEKANNNSSK